MRLWVVAFMRLWVSRFVTATQIVFVCARLCIYAFICRSQPVHLCVYLSRSTSAFMRLRVYTYVSAFVCLCVWCCRCCCSCCPMAINAQLLYCMCINILVNSKLAESVFARCELLNFKENYLNNTPRQLCNSHSVSEMSSSQNRLNQNQRDHHCMYRER